MDIAKQTINLIAANNQILAPLILHAITAGILAFILSTQTKKPAYAIGLRPDLKPVRIVKAPGTVLSSGSAAYYDELRANSYWPHLGPGFSLTRMTFSRFD